MRTAPRFPPIWVLAASFLTACAPHEGVVGDGSAGDGGSEITLAITPSGAVVTVTTLAPPTELGLTATATYPDGHNEKVPATWTLDRLDIATIDPQSGLLSTTGNAFGIVSVTANAVGASAKADVAVVLKLVQGDSSITPTDRGKLDGASAVDPLVTGLLYPYDKTVFPRALLAPELMWRGGDDADRYRIHFTADAFDLTIYTAAPYPSRYTLGQALWTALGASAKGGGVMVELRRLDPAGDAFVSTTQRWTLADANLRGTIYYWAVNQGQIISLDVSTGTRSLALDSGPSTQLGTPTPINAGSPASPPWEDNGGGKRCVACHAVSKDGSRLSSVFSRAGSAGPLGVVDLSNQQISSISDYTTSTAFTALTPDGKLEVANGWNKRMTLVDTATGLSVASDLDILIDVCDPAFSPDGTRFALATSCDPGFGSSIEFRASNLSVYDFAQAQSKFSNPRTLFISTGLGDAIAFPSFSPDGKLIVFQRGSYSRAKYGNGSASYLHGVDDLYIARDQPNTTAIALDAANGKGVLPADSLHLNYAPTVNPIAEGGYIWVVFTSPRDYGNRMMSPQLAAPQDATWSNHKQLWVTAIDVNVGAVDPSHPAFWLPGQSPDTVNMFGYWSLSPCKPTINPATSMSSSCTAGFECCSGFCRDTGSGPVCIDTTNGCHVLGDKCAASADCCDAAAGVSCVAGFCQGVGVQ